MPNELIDREFDTMSMCHIPHRCETCGEYIDPGEVMYFSVAGKESCCHCV